MTLCGVGMAEGLVEAAAGGGPLMVTAHLRGSPMWGHVGAALVLMLSTLTRKAGYCMPPRYGGSGDQCQQ